MTLNHSDGPADFLPSLAVLQIAPETCREPALILHLAHAARAIEDARAEIQRIAA